MSNSWSPGNRKKQRKTCKCGCFKKLHYARVKESGSMEYKQCLVCDCKNFRAKAHGEV
jgi:hypothetical protein